MSLISTHSGGKTSSQRKYSKAKIESFPPFKQLLYVEESGKSAKHQTESTMLVGRGSDRSKGNCTSLINDASNTKNDLKVELERYFNEFLAGTAGEPFFISEGKCLKINQGL